MIPLELDILSPSTFKATNSHATTRAWRSVPEYIDVLRHASSLIALPMREPLTSYSSLSAIQTLLVKSLWTKCNRVGSFVLLPEPHHCFVRCAVEAL